MPGVDALRCPIVGRRCSCASATARLRNGDRVRVSGGQGVVEILSEAGDEIATSQ